MSDPQEILYAFPKAPDSPPTVALVANELSVEDLPKGEITRLFIELIGDGLATGIRVPMLVARGIHPGPVFGITSALHGNELNGIYALHNLFEKLDPQQLHGTVVGVLVLNVPGLHRHQREFNDGTDLNHIFPGNEFGNAPQVYAHRILTRITHDFDFLVDLHTASFGRVNSLYIRADLSNPITARMAYLQQPEIIVHNPASDYTLRGTMMERGIPSITVEIGDPQRFQQRYIQITTDGLHRTLAELGMIKNGDNNDENEPEICRSSFWMFTDRGGLLEVLPTLTQKIYKDELVAIVRNAFGDIIRKYHAPQDGIVIGKSTNPIGQTGARILHLGRLGPPSNAAASSPLPSI